MIIIEKIIEAKENINIGYLMFEKCEKCNDYIDEFNLCGCLNDEIKDNNAVDEFAKAMKEKLAKARAKGRRGWNDKEACSDEHLAMLFNGHLKKCNDGNFIDIANFCMFLHVRGANPNVLSLAKEVFFGVMTREEAKKELDKFEVPYGVYDTVEIIFDEHEAQLKEYQEDIYELEQQCGKLLAHEEHGLEVVNELESELKAKDEKLQQLDDAYASVVSDFESAVMELAKKDKEIEKLKKQYHQCLDDYIKCAERKDTK